MKTQSLEKVHQWISFLDVRGYLVFLASLLVAVNVLIFSNSVWAIIIFFFLCIRILSTRFYPLIICSVLCGVLSLGYFNYCNQSIEFEKSSLLEGALPATELQVFPDTVEIDGNLFQFQGRVKLQGQKIVQVVASYRIKSVEEKTKLANFDWKIELVVVGQLNSPETQRNLNGFDYQKYLQNKQIYRSLQIENIVNAKTKNNSLKMWYPGKYIRQLRAQIHRYIDQIFPKTTAIYMKSLLLGIKDSDFYQELSSLQKLSCLHVLSLSGLHLYFFINLLRYLILRFGITLEGYFWIKIIFLIGYFGLTGATTGIGRAAIQIALLSINRRFQFGLSKLDCWALNLSFMCLLQPLVFQQTAGQFSYILTLFLLLAQPTLKKIKQPIMRSIAYTCLLTVTALPLNWFHFHEWHLIGFVLPLILVPIIRYLLLPVLSTFFVVSLFWRGIGYSVCGVLLDQFLSTIQILSDILITFEKFHIITGKIQLWQLILCLGGLIVWWCLLQQRCLKKWHTLSLITIFIMVCFSKYFSPVGKLAFVDVGQGDAIFVQLPFHSGNLLIDTGGKLALPQKKWEKRMNQPTNAERTLIPFLKSQGVKQLDKVFITHADADHTGDLLNLQKEIPICEVYYAKGTEKKASFKRAIEKLQKQGTLSYPILAEQLYQYPSVQLQLLHPWHSGEGGNTDSLVFYAIIKETTFLLTGDLDEAGEMRLLQRYPRLRVDVLKAGHHGSKTSSSEKFLSSLEPSEAIVSCGKNNRYGHPHPETINRFKQLHTKIYRTDQNGMLFYRWYFWKKQIEKIKMIKYPVGN